MNRRKLVALAALLMVSEVNGAAGAGAGAEADDVSCTACGPYRTEAERNARRIRQNPLNPYFRETESVYNKKEFLDRRYERLLLGHYTYDTELANEPKEYRSTFLNLAVLPDLTWEYSFDHIVKMSYDLLDNEELIDLSEYIKAGIINLTSEDGEIKIKVKDIALSIVLFDAYKKALLINKPEINVAYNEAVAEYNRLYAQADKKHKESNRLKETGRIPENRRKCLVFDSEADFILHKAAFERSKLMQGWMDVAFAYSPTLLRIVKEAANALDENGKPRNGTPIEDRIYADLLRDYAAEAAGGAGAGGAGAGGAGAGGAADSSAAHAAPAAPSAAVSSAAQADSSVAPSVADAGGAADSSAAHAAPAAPSPAASSAAHADLSAALSRTHDFAAPSAAPAAHTDPSSLQ